MEKRLSNAIYASINKAAKSKQIMSNKTKVDSEESLSNAIYASINKAAKKNKDVNLESVTSTMI